MKVAVVYHCFAHYRRPVFEELGKYASVEWHLYGADHDPSNSGIETFRPEPPLVFHQTKCKYLGGLLFQSQLVGLALRSKLSAIIYLGDVHYVTTWVSAALARLTGKTVLFWTHGWTRVDRGFKGSVRRTFYKLAHGLLLYGDRAKEIGTSFGFAEQRLIPIYNSLDYATQKAAREQTTSAETPAFRAQTFSKPDLPMVVCPARITVAQRYDLLLDALSILRARGREVNVLLIGDGPKRNEIEHRAREENVNVVILPPCYREEQLRVYLMAADVCVSPGKVGLTAMHCLAYGVPIITHGNLNGQMPEVEAIQAGVNGMFFEEGNPTSLATAISNWLSLPAEKRSDRRSKYAIIEEKYTPEGQARRIMNALQTKLR